jgi:hypothetical protein
MSPAVAVSRWQVEVGGGGLAKSHSEVDDAGLGGELDSGAPDGPARAQSLGGCGEGRWRQRQAWRGSRKALRDGSGHITGGWTEGKRENTEYEVMETYDSKKRKLVRRPLE